MASVQASEAARPLAEEHPEDHEGDELVASARLRRAQARIEAMRPDAETMRELIAGVGRERVGPRAAAPPAARRAPTVALVPLTGTAASPGRSTGRSCGRVRARAGAAAAGPRSGSWRRPEGPLDAGVPRLRRRRRVHRLHRPARVRRCAGDRPPRRRALHGERDRPGDPRLQRVRLPARPAGDRAGRPADLGRHPRDRRGGAPRRRPARRLHLRARAGGILARLLPVYIETQIYRALLESAASEQGARMTAMRNASKNAGELIDR